MNWEQALAPYVEDSPKLFSASFLERWGKQDWQPSSDDKTAAAMLHTQINSRITTQRLGYLDGVEKTALDSVYALFQATRDINDRFPAARHFDALAWEVLNNRVRPFTARWHHESERGMLGALDATDEFRAQLTQLQNVLRRFDNLLLKLQDETVPVAVLEGASERESQIVSEMAAKVEFGIPTLYGGIKPVQATAINTCEKEAIKERRSHYGVRKDAPDAAGLALSGGGIRSATFSLGVLVALAQRNLLPQIDYLSTVSGGGYVGSFLSAFLSSSADGEIGLRSTELPFRRESGEPEALRYIRHHCKYLSTGSTWDRLAMVSAQLYGMILNGLAVVIFLALVVAVEHVLRDVLPHGTLKVIIIIAILLTLGCGLFSFLTLRIWKDGQKNGDLALALSFVFLLGTLCLGALEPAHLWFQHLLSSGKSLWSTTKWLGALGAVPVISSGLNTLFGRLRKHLSAVLIVLSGIAVPVFLFGVYLALYAFADHSVLTLPYIGQVFPNCILWIAAIGGVVGYLLLFDLNSTSPHRYYRDRLADAFLIRHHEKQKGAGKDAQKPADTFDSSVSMRLSQLKTQKRCPYHLINCALNVPGSKNIALQGRLTDFFLFSPCFSGSPLTQYHSTSEWEGADTHLDLGTAMAISAAAAAPQMGLATMRTLSFWLALLNVRLGYWAKKPDINLSFLAGAPGLFCLWQEMLGTVNENSPWLNLSDGGHIENLGVYELLRRRCKYIIAVDGEEDAKMTFHGLTTLQRLAAIDLGVRIDINLDDLRLNDQRLSRSHFRFCRIRYPKAGRGSEDEFGYLLYVKLSLTGNEGEFIRRYRLDNPAFPHDSTANQFFTEAQFEAYRSLGEHVGDKLFLKAIVGEFSNATLVTIEEWFLQLGKGLLDPLRDAAD
jgi:Patatin-like phospholipase